MSRYFLGFIFLLFVTQNKVAFSQELVYQDKKQFTYYFEKRNPVYTSWFDMIGDCPQDAFIKYNAEIQLEVFRQKETYSILLKVYPRETECLCRYRNFLVANFIATDKVTLRGSVKSNGILIAEFDLKNKEISDKGIVFDTNYISNSDLTGFQFLVSEMECHLEEKSIAYFKKGLNRIDNFFLFDSLFANWQHQLDLLDISNVDMLPIYQFQLKDIESEVKGYDGNEYEVLLSRSGMDNREYLQKRSLLFKRIEGLTLELSQKMVVMDELMFEKAKHHEEEHNFERAIFYYNRTLDYNPLHCDALERLSDLYTQNNLHKENLDLFTSLRIRGENVVCESSLTNSVCDSMCMKANYLIANRNYYDAIKFLDTMEMLFYQMPDNEYFQTYLSLRKQAQDGIYNSYLDVISRAIKGNKIELGKEYIYGLVAIMEKDENNPVDNPLYMQMMERFISRYKENIKNLVRRKKYEEVVQGNDAMVVFLDSIHYVQNEELFFDSYSISCNELYLEKKKQSQEDAITFFNLYGKYITVSTDGIADKQAYFTEDLSDERRYKLLTDYVLTWNIAPDDISMLDSVAMLLQLRNEKEYTDTLWDSLFVERKITPMIMNALSKVNQYAWVNEFSLAAELMKKVDNLVPMLDLYGEASDVSSKYVQTAELLTQRINQRAEQEFNTFSKEIQYLVSQKQYLEAYQLLNNENLFLRRTTYQPQINRLLKEVETPAIFQEKMVSVEQSLALEDFSSGFAQYEEAYNYFKGNDIASYGLTCDSLFSFVKGSEWESFLKGASVYYMESGNYMAAMDIMMYLIDLGYKSQDLQIKLGSAMKQSSYSFTVLKERYSFSKVHKPFLESFLGKFGAFWYNVKSWKIFSKKKDKEV